MKSLKRSFWSNGMIQHAFFQAKLFHALGYKVYMITPEIDTEHKSFEFLEQVMEGWLTRNLYWIKSEQSQWKELQFDLYLVWETNLTETIIRDIKTRFECPVIAIQCGNEGISIWDEFCQNQTTTIHRTLSPNGTSRYDQIWTLPHYSKFKTLYDSLYQINTQIVPYLWEPFLIEPYMKHHTFQIIYTLLKTDRPIVSVCEPNRDFTKMSLYPILGASKICNGIIHVYGKQCDAPIQHLRIQNIEYKPRTPIYTILQSTTIVVSHQIMNELNYLHLECAWFGIPIIHNSPMLKEIGWYYKEYEIDDIPDVWNQIRQLSYIDYLKKVQHDRTWIRSHYSTNVQTSLDYFKHAVEEIC